MPRGKDRKRCLPAGALLDQFEEGTWASIIAEHLGVTRATIQRWRNGKSFLDPYTADRLAVKLGKHPCQIWPEWFDLPLTSKQEKRNDRK